MMEVKTNTTNIINNLSFTETNAIKAIAEAMEGENEKIIIVSTIAEDKKFTRSVCVSALRILQACGVIDTRSLGMKGMHIKILNKAAFEMIA